MITVKKDPKGPCYIVSHKRCGITIAEFFSLTELVELKQQIEEILKNNEGL